MESIQQLLITSEQFPHPRSTVVVSAGIIVLLTLVFRSLGHLFNDGRFKSTDGKQIKSIDTETRIIRFVNGPGLSAQGQALAGDEPYLIRNGNFRELVITTPRHLQEFVRGDYKDHKKAVNMNLGHFAGQIYGQALGSQNGANWKKMRGHFDPSFSHQSAVQMVPRLSEVIQQWTRTLAAHGFSSSLANRAFQVDVVKACKYLSFRVIGMSLYGDAFNESILLELLNLKDLHDKLIITGLVQPMTKYVWYNRLPIAATRQMKTFHQQWRDFNRKTVKEAAKKQMWCPAEYIYRAVDAGEMKEIEFLQTLIEILFANVDINGDVLAVLMNGLAGDEKLQEKMRAEITIKKQGDIVNYASKQDTLLHCLSLESIRLMNGVHFSHPELSGSDKVIDGYFVPAKTPVVIDVKRVNRHTSLWGPDASTYRPERFLELSPTHWRHGMIRYGIAGGRCLGKNVADFTLKIVAVSVLETYRLAKVDAEISQESKQPKGPPAILVRFEERVE